MFVWSPQVSEGLGRLGGSGRRSTRRSPRSENGLCVFMLSTVLFFYILDSGPLASWLVGWLDGWSMDAWMVGWLGGWLVGLLTFD